LKGGAIHGEQRPRPVEFLGFVLRHSPRSLNVLDSSRFWVFEQIDLPGIQEWENTVFY